MQIERSLSATMSQLHHVLSQLSTEEYRQPLPILNFSSIGQHTRHILEFLQVLINSYNSGVVNYDKRKRNVLLETDPDHALSVLLALMDQVQKSDKEVLLVGSYSPEETEDTIVRSSYHRELVYNLEHAIHHMAIIRIGLRQSTNHLIPDDFGVAPTTIQYKKSIL